MKYDYNVNSHRKKKFLKRVYTAGTVILLLAVAAGVAIRIDSELQKNRNPTSATTSQQTTGYFAPSTQIFNTPYFQFQANKTWAEVPAESTSTKFVYSSLRGSLIEHSLTIYVDEIPENLSATHVMPTRMRSNNTELIPQSVSSHCKEVAGASQAADRLVDIKKVKLLCNIDSPQYEVMVGTIGGSTQLSLSRPNGEKKTYTIFYRNVTAKPEAVQLSEITSSFQTR